MYDDLLIELVRDDWAEQLYVNGESIAEGRQLEVEDIVVGLIDALDLDARFSVRSGSHFDDEE